MSNLMLQMENIKAFLENSEIDRLQDRVRAIHKDMEAGSGAGSDYLGWLGLPSHTGTDLMDDIKNTANQIRSEAEVLITIGIGGSYLGAKAAIEFSGHSFGNRLSSGSKGPELYFAGQNISSDYLSDLLDVVSGKSIYINVISKSGTTTEPAIAFRVLKAMVEERYGREEAKKRIIATTDSSKGALKKLADEEGYKTFVIPDDVGGRFSVLTPVGLLPIAAAGIDIDELMDGAKSMEASSSNPDLSKNSAYRYAAARSLLYGRGKVIEILSTFHPSLHYLGEWWKQLAGESEGKDGGGIFPASVDLTTDLHSMGQWIQEGKRIIFETFLTVENSSREMTIPFVEGDPDGLNYISGKSLDFVNEKAYLGTAMAHLEGGVPNMTIKLKDRSAHTLGELFYFFERAVAMTGYLAGVNPFDQPGVEFYKKNMFRLLGKTS